jgi:8-oxo-dGTP diphosphatase
MLPFKISVLVFVRNEAGEILLIERTKEPNKGCWSPIGGKLEMQLGESPYECAIRETEEEIGLQLTEHDLHLFCMISEKGYEGKTHWLMFLFDCLKPIHDLPPTIDEGQFSFFKESAIDDLPIPETDRKLLWDIYKQGRSGFTALRANCFDGIPQDVVVEQGDAEA